MFRFGDEASLRRGFLGGLTLLALLITLAPTLPDPPPVRPGTEGRVILEGVGYALMALVVGMALGAWCRPEDREERTSR